MQELDRNRDRHSNKRKRDNRSCYNDADDNDDDVDDVVVKIYTYLFRLYVRIRSTSIINQIRIQTGLQKRL